MIRSDRLRAQHHQYSKLIPAESLGQHNPLSSSARRAAIRGENTPLETPSTDYRLPVEREENTAFVDEYLESLAVQRGEETLHLRINWNSSEPYTRFSLKAP